MVVATMSLGCYPPHLTPLPSCDARGGASTAGGSLEILPSKIPGVAIDSARWQSVTLSPDNHTQTFLRYWAWLSASATVPIARIGVQFHSDRPVEDTLLLVPGSSFFKKLPGGVTGVEMPGDSIRLGEPRSAMSAQQSPGQFPGPWGCPRAAQLIELR
jgi:hypothetical protein